MCRCIVGAATTLSGHEGGDVKSGRNNQHVVGVCVWQGTGVGEGTASTVPVGNGIPQSSRSATAAFFARMDVVVRRRGGGCGNGR